MQCDKFEAHVQDLLDRRESPEKDSTLRQHALVCDRCAETLAAQEALFAGLGNVRVPELSADFTERVLIASKSRRDGGSWRTLALSLCALAAALLIVLLPTWLVLRAVRSGGPVARDRSATEQPGAMTPSTLQAVDRRPLDRPGDSDSPSPVREREVPATDVAVVDPDQPEAGAQPPVAPERPRLSLLEPYRGILPTAEDLRWVVPTDLAAVDPERAEALKAVWVDRVAKPLKPVTSSVTGAFDVVRRTLADGPAWRDNRPADEKPQADAGGPPSSGDLV
jgi:hypothetical protein